MDPNPAYPRKSEVFYKTVRQFLGAVPGSIRHHLNTEELFRIAVTSATSGGGFFGFLQLVAAGAGAVFLVPADAALAVAVLTLVLDARRRLRHGGVPCVQPANGPGGTPPEERHQSKSS